MLGFTFDSTFDLDFDLASARREGNRSSYLRLMIVPFSSTGRFVVDGPANDAWERCQPVFLLQDQTPRVSRSIGDTYSSPKMPIGDLAPGQTEKAPRIYSAKGTS